MIRMVLIRVIRFLNRHDKDGIDTRESDLLIVMIRTVLIRGILFKNRHDMDGIDTGDQTYYSS